MPLVRPSLRLHVSFGESRWKQGQSFRLQLGTSGNTASWSSNLHDSRTGGTGPGSVDWQDAMGSRTRRNRTGRAARAVLTGKAARAGIILTGMTAKPVLTGRAARPGIILTGRAARAGIILTGGAAGVGYHCFYSLSVITFAELV